MQKQISEIQITVCRTAVLVQSLFFCFFTTLMNQTSFTCHRRGNFVPQTYAIAALAVELGFSSGKGIRWIHRKELQKHSIYRTAYSSAMNSDSLN